MSRLRFPTASRGAADSVAGPSLGFQQTSVTAEGSVDLTPWVGQYVKVQVIGDDYDLAFVAAAATTIATGNVAVGGAAVAERLANGATTGASTQFIVPGGYSVLKYKPVNGASSSIRVTRS